MKIKLIVLVTIGICFFKTTAQTPGYLGKRLNIGYGLHMSPAISGSNAHNKSFVGDGGNAETGVPAFNVIHELNIEYAKSTKWMLCFSTRFYRTTYDNWVYLSARGYDYSQPKGYYAITGLTYSLYFKYYGSRYLAPWGRYVMFGPVLNTAITSYDPAIMKAKYNDGNTLKETSNFGPKKQNFAGINLMLGWGRTRIIGERITLDYGCNFQLFSVLTIPVDVFKLDLISPTNIATTSYIEETYKIRVRGVNRFNVFLKIGVLL